MHFGGNKEAFPYCAIKSKKLGVYLSMSTDHIGEKQSEPAYSNMYYYSFSIFIFQTRTHSVIVFVLEFNYNYFILINLFSIKALKN